MKLLGQHVTLFHLHWCSCFDRTGVRRGVSTGLKELGQVRLLLLLLLLRTVGSHGLTLRVVQASTGLRQHGLGQVGTAFQGMLSKAVHVPTLDRPLQLLSQPRVGRNGGHAPALDSTQTLGQGPDVVVGKPECLDLGQLGLVWKGWQDGSELFQGQVESVHPIAFSIVGLGSSRSSQPQLLGRTSVGGSGRPTQRRSLEASTRALTTQESNDNDMINNKIKG